MRHRKVITTVAAAAIAVLAGGTAYAAVAGGPPVTSPPGKVGPYYSQGTAVNECVNQVTQQVRVETRTVVLGNCSTDEVQLTVTADPSALAPAPKPTVTPTATPTG